MTKFCGKCCEPFIFLDVITYEPDTVAYHTVVCPKDRWPVDWLKVKFNVLSM